MEHYIRKGGSLTQEEKNVKYGQEILELTKPEWAPKQVVVMYCLGHQNGEKTAVGGNLKADREDKKAALTRGQPSASLAAALSLCPLSKWDPRHNSQEQASFLRLKEEVSCHAGGGNLPMTVLQFQSHWLPHLSNSSMEELTQSGQLSRPPWSNIFMSPNSPA
jgi:hypothetical protein